MHVHAAGTKPAYMHLQTHTRTDVTHTNTRKHNTAGALAQDLCEQLRTVLEPSLATKMKGDYRTGKRLNMKKIIPYIASQFKKDKIWLRRAKPAKREYQVRVFVCVHRVPSRVGCGADGCVWCVFGVLAVCALHVWWVCACARMCAGVLRATLASVQPCEGVRVLNVCKSDAIERTREADAAF